MTAYRFIEPQDVLFLRGNKLFGDPGSYGESLIPPWPSVAAGAIRSHILSHDGMDLNAFAQGVQSHSQLGTPAEPGSFRLSGFHLARRKAGAAQTLHPIPADLVVSETGEEVALRRLMPTPATIAVETSYPLPQWPVFASDQRTKPVSGVWLTQDGWRQYLNGEVPDQAHIEKTDNLWKINPRVGVGLDPNQRRAEDGKLFSVQAIALEPNVGFLAAIDGVEPPKKGMLRFGGDGRAAVMEAVNHKAPQVGLAAIAKVGRCRLVLTSPGLFAQGWLPNGMTQDEEGAYHFHLHGVSARLVCAAVSRAEVISGWDLAQRQPKPAHRVVPTGSVYWLEALDATPESLAKLVEQGLWSERCEDPQRRAEGFNRLTIAAY